MASHHSGGKYSQHHFLGQPVSRADTPTDAGTYKLPVMQQQYYTGEAVPTMYQLTPEDHGGLSGMDGDMNIPTAASDRCRVQNTQLTDDWTLSSSPAVKFGDPNLNESLASLMQYIMLPSDINNPASTLWTTGDALPFDAQSPFENDSDDLFLFPADLAPSDGTDDSPGWHMDLELGGAGEAASGPPPSLPLVGTMDNAPSLGYDVGIAEVLNFPRGDVDRAQQRGESALSRPLFTAQATGAESAEAAVSRLVHEPDFTLRADARSMPYLEPASGVRRRAIERSKSPSSSLGGAGSDGKPNDTTLQQKEFKLPPPHLAAEAKRREVVKEGFDMIRERLPYANAGISRAAVLRKGAERIASLKQEIATLRLRLEEAQKSDLESSQRKSSAESNIEDLTKACKEMQIKAQPPIDEQMGKREEVPEEIVRLQTDESIDDAYRRFQRDETDQSVLRLLLYLRNPDPNGPKRRGQEGGLFSEEGASGEAMDKAFCEEPDEVGVDSSGMATGLSNVAGGRITNRPETRDVQKLPTIYSVKQESVDALWEELSHKYDQAIGGVRFQSIDWQKGRVRSFLFACNGNPKKAYERCALHYAWLMEYRPDAIKQSDIPHELESGKLRWLSQRNADGRWVLYFQASLHQISERTRKEAMQLWFYRIVEFIERLADNPTASFICVMDVRNLSRNTLDPQLFRKFLTLLSQHYPTILHRVYVLDPAWLFHFIHMVLRPLVPAPFWETMRLLEAPGLPQKLLSVIGDDNMRELKEFFSEEHRMRD